MDGGVLTSSPPLDAYENSLRHCNSIPQSVVVPANLKLLQQSSSYTSSGTSSSSSSSSSSSASSGEFDLISVKAVSYTSLRDLLPSTAVNSPKPAQNQVQSGSEISIRNRLVKQAAWAYLQPMSTSPDSSGRSFLHRLWNQFTSENPLAALFRFFDRHVFGRLNRAFDWLLRAIWVRRSRYQR